MVSIVRRAQKNYKFTMIFRQRRRDEILIAGFNSLADTVNGVGDRITGSVSDLSEQISSMGDLIDNGFRMVGEQIFNSSQLISKEIRKGNLEQKQALSKLQSTFDKISEQNKTSISERELQHAKTIEILEDIRHGREPLTLVDGVRGCIGIIRCFGTGGTT